MSSDVVDLEDIAKNWALSLSGRYTNSTRKVLFPSDCKDCQIDWTGAKVTRGETTFENVTWSSNEQVLYRATFTNKTNQDQTHSIRIERVTTSTCDVVIEKGVTTGPEMGVQLKLPSMDLAVNSGFKRVVTLTKAEGETFEKEMTWLVDTSVTVPPGHKTTAELKVEEKQFNGSFTIVSKMWGKVHVSVFDRRDNTFVSSCEGDVCRMIKKRAGVVDDIESGCFHFKTQGECNFRYAAQQHFEVFQERLPSY